jgi:uncharacterized protein
VTFQANPGPGYGMPSGGIQTRPATVVSAALLTHAFFWMFLGLLLSAVVAGAVQLSAGLLSFAESYFLLLLVGQFALVMAIGVLINRISALAALGLFFVYAASLGVTVGVLVAAYTATSVVSAFLSASAMFGGAALYGVTTKRSLAGMGGMLTMAVFGLVIAILVNWFLGSSLIGWVISLIGVVVFTGLTAWDVQRISTGNLVALTGSVEKAAVLGALHLYLDFVNLFLFLLRLLGARR